MIKNVYVGMVEIPLAAWNSEEPCYENLKCVASQFHRDKITLSMVNCEQSLPVLCVKGDNEGGKM